jgi:hypothetical protein
MKKYFFIILTILASVSFGQTKKVEIGNFKFSFKTKFINNKSGDSIKQIEIYRDNAKLITHIISEYDGDCNSESIELGDYEVTDTTLILFSYWTRAGDAPVSPFGVRKQIYQVDKSGKFNLIKSELYIETSRKGWKENKGIEYLYSTPINANQKKLLKEYIEEVEKKYNAKFVFGNYRTSLLSLVRTKLKKQILSKTKHWKDVYSNKIGGYKV